MEHSSPRADVSRALHIFHGSCLLDGGALRAGAALTDNPDSGSCGSASVDGETNMCFRPATSSTSRHCSYGCIFSISLLLLLFSFPHSSVLLGIELLVSTGLLLFGRCMCHLLRPSNINMLFLVSVTTTCGALNHTVVGHAMM